MSKSKATKQKLRVDDAEPTAPHGRKRRSWLKRLALVLVLGATLLAGMLWWQERALSQATQALEQGETKYAMYLVDKFLERHPRNTRALALQARGLVDLGYPDETIRIFDDIGAASVDDMHALARAYMIRGQWTSAQTLLQRILQLTPDDPNALYEIASCQIRLGQFDEALVNAQQFSAQPGQTARGYVMIGSIYGDMRDDRAAADAFARVLVEEPEAQNLQIPPAELFLRYGRVLLRLGKPQESLDPLKRCVASQPTGEAFTLLGDAASQLGHADNAASAWKQAVAFDPQSYAARSSLANAAMLEGNGKQAIEWLEPIAGDDNLPSRTAYLLQRAYLLLGDENSAASWQKKTAELRREEQHLATLENALISQPQAFWSLAVRAHRFASEGNWLQADLIVERLVQEAPGDPFVIELTDAIRRRSNELPALTRIPVTNF